jgi:hypothetical protein
MEMGVGEEGLGAGFVVDREGYWGCRVGDVD